MAERFHIGICPLCRQGRLMLFRNTASDDVYGHCEECEQGYLSPDELEGRTGGVLTLQSDEEAEWATAEEVRRSVWANYRIWLVEKA